MTLIIVSWKWRFDVPRLTFQMSRKLLIVGRTRELKKFALVNALISLTIFTLACNNSNLCSLCLVERTGKYNFAKSSKKNATRCRIIVYCCTFIFICETRRKWMCALLILLRFLVWNIRQALNGISQGAWKWLESASAMLTFAGNKQRQKPPWHLNFLLSL